ncbi:SRP-dependent cotranslational protein targeting to membrane [Pristimantis euphronides]
MKIECDQCHSNFCLSHRHPSDHECKSKGRALSKAGFAALKRSQKTSEQNRAAVHSPTEVTPSGCCRAVHKSNHPVIPGEPVIGDFGLHNGLSEEEGLQRALELSLLEAGINNLLTLRNPTINTIKTGSQ